MEINLLKENDSKLSEVSESWDFEKDGDPIELVKAMTKLMFEKNGIGLAAPQCGILKNLFIMGNESKLIVCINPKVLTTVGHPEVYTEGCLSFPNLWLNVKRPPAVEVEYQTITGEKVIEHLEGLPARVFLHEYDHLIGVTFDEKVGALGLSLAKNRRLKAQKKLSRHSLNKSNASAL